jgi:NADH-quinone oxidoreductase subunit H
MIPDNVDKWLFIVAPAFLLIPAALALVAIPFGADVKIGDRIIELRGAPLDLGLLFIMCIVSMSAYGLVFGGWASNNKYSLSGGLRSAAQLISYELIWGLAIVTVIVMCGTLDLSEIVKMQAKHGWFIFLQPFAFILFFISALAENARLPFDLPEAEPELVGGYHTEYSSMKFSLYFIGEYVAVALSSAFCVTLFLGGWHFPGIVDPESTDILNAILSHIVFLVKMFFVVFVYMWIRWTLPRFKFDHLMKLSWKYLLPLSFLNLIVTALACLL